MPTFTAALTRYSALHLVEVVDRFFSSFCHINLKAYESTYDGLLLCFTTLIVERVGEASIKKIDKARRSIILILIGVLVSLCMHSSYY